MILYELDILLIISFVINIQCDKCDSTNNNLTDILKN